MNTFIKPATAFTFVLSTCFSLSVVLSYVSCKKKSITPPETVINALCDGNGSLSYIPIKAANKWTVDASSPYLDHTLEVTGTKTLGGKEYFETHYLSQAENYMMYYRADANGDIYKYNASDAKEYLDVPVNPTLGQVVATFNSGDFLKVADVNATYNTGKCVYTGLLKIEWNSNGNVISTHYYKKGVGKVGETSNLGPQNLVDVKLN
jgi:hypothetical protein